MEISNVDSGAQMPKHTMLGQGDQAGTKSVRHSGWQGCRALRVAYIRMPSAESRSRSINNGTIGVSFGRRRLGRESGRRSEGHGGGKETGCRQRSG
jgi:hypothetical protein